MKTTDQIILEASVLIAWLAIIILCFHISYLRHHIDRQAKEIKELKDELTNSKKDFVGIVKDLTEQTWKN